jgi:hypothetical protein
MSWREKKDTTEEGGMDNGRRKRERGGDKSGWEVRKGQEERDTVRKAGVTDTWEELLTKLLFYKSDLSAGHPPPPPCRTQKIHKYKLLYQTFSPRHNKIISEDKATCLLDKKSPKVYNGYCVN